MNRQITLPYGRESRTIAVPEENLAWVAGPKNAPPVADLRQAVRSAIRNPIGSPTLAELVLRHGLSDERMFVVAEFQKFTGPDFFNRSKHLNDQHAVMRDDGASAFADDVRVRHIFGVANVGDVIDHVVRVFLKRVIRSNCQTPTGCRRNPRPARRQRRDRKSGSPSCAVWRKAARPPAPPFSP